MIKIFRKIRKGLLSENRFGKYLLYAIGEIVLVVIGILIALNLNNRNEQRKAQVKVELIFEDVMNDLIADIKATEMPMNYFARRDSIIHLVLSDNVTFDDYANDNFMLNNLTNFHNPVTLTQNSYNNLIRNLDNVPQKYKPVINDLNVLYNYNKEFVIETNKGIADFIKENEHYGMRNYPWHYRRNESEWKQNVKYKLEDFRYKNQVSEYQILGKSNQLRMSLMYRKEAIDCYKKIAEILNKPLNHESFTFDQEIANILVGDWYIIDIEQEAIVSYFMKNKRLYGKTNFNNSEFEVFYLPELNKILHEELQYGTLVRDNHEAVIKFNSHKMKRK